MSDVIVIEQCCYCHRNLSLDKLIHNESKDIYYCSDSDDCRLAQEQAHENPVREITREHARPTGKVWSYQYRQSSCGNALTGFLVGVGVFFGCWIYAIKTYGWFLGLGLGWIPSFFFAVMAGMFWPLAVLIILGILIFSK